MERCVCGPGGGWGDTGHKALMLGVNLPGLDLTPRRPYYIGTRGTRGPEPIPLRAKIYPEGKEKAGQPCASNTSLAKRMMASFDGIGSTVLSVSHPAA